MISTSTMMAMAVRIDSLKFPDHQFWGGGTHMTVVTPDRQNAKDSDATR